MREKQPGHDIRGVLVQFTRVAIVSVVTVGATIAGTTPAHACGGCFHQPPAPTPTGPPQTEVDSVVTDHRMAFSVSQDRTVLWDQIRYQGNPAEFVWAIPVRPGTIVELSSNRWVAALDAYTAPVVTSPLRYVTNPSSGSGGGYGYGGGYDNGGGCGFGGCSSSETTAAFDNAGNPSSGATDGGAVQSLGPPPVTVVDQEVVGPYETVTLRSTNPTALEDWLVSHGYEIPAAIKPVVSAYVAAGFDFIALRLRPHVDVGAMQPVRIISPGADLSLPLRMVAAGVGANVGITLFVISEGRYHPQNFPDVNVDFTKLFWDFANERSNYQELAVAALAENGGRGFLTEFAQPTFLEDAPDPDPSAVSLNGLYFGSCDGEAPQRDVSPNMYAMDASTSDAGPSSCAGMSDGGDVDAADGGDPGDAGDPADASACVSEDASTPDAGFPGTLGCGLLDDIFVASQGLDPGSIWVTRMRANLPVSALSADLVLEATAQQSVPNQHTAKDPQNPTASSIAPTRDTGVGSILLGLGTIALVAVRLRRRLRAS